MERAAIKEIVTKVMGEFSVQAQSFPVEMSARHVHLTQEAVETLFGKEAQLLVKRELSLPGFLAEQRVNLVTAKGILKNVAVLGPVRSYTQVELAASDAFALGIAPPVQLSGNLAGAADVYIVGPKGMLFAQGSAIIAQAHIHMSPEEASALHLQNQQMVSVDVLGRRAVTLKNIVVRVEQGMRLTMHIDMDEANACGHDSQTRGILSNTTKE